MKKRILLALMLVVCVAVLCACQSNTPKYTVVEKNPPAQATQNLNMGGTQGSNAGDTITNFDDGSYDPTSEEGRGDDMPDIIWDEPTEAPATPVPTVRSEYAGATPVVIDPIDKPTATPVPPISFTFQAYEATKLHLAFEAPVGWVADDSAADTFVLRNPDPSMDYVAAVTLTATKTASQMGKSALEDQVESMLNAIKSGENVKKFEPSRTAERSLMDQTGIYANYTATLDDGTLIAGRVHATCINKVMYTIHITYPRAYRDTYVDSVYGTLRKTLSITQ